MVDAAERTPVQALSKRAFNSDHRLSIVAALLERRHDLFDKQQIVTATGAPSTSVYNELMDLHSLGLLTRTRDGNRVVFTIVDGPFWAWCETLLKQLQKDTKPSEITALRVN